MTLSNDNYFAEVRGLWVWTLMSKTLANEDTMLEFRSQGANGPDGESPD